MGMMWCVKIGTGYFLKQLSMLFTKEQFTRYSRQIFLPEVGVQGMQKIKAAKVLVVGAGGLGSPLLQYLAGAGVGTIGIADHDVVELHNLHRQVLYGTDDVGLSKTGIAARQLASLNSDIKLIEFRERIDAENAGVVIADFDIVVDGSDNFQTRYLVNDTCVALEKPLVYGSILHFQGQVAVFNHNGGKHLRHLFTTSPHPDDVPDCGVNGVLGPLPGIIGSMMAMEVLKLTIGMPTLHNQLLLLDAGSWNFSKVSF